MKKQLFIAAATLALGLSSCAKEGSEVQQAANEATPATEATNDKSVAPKAKTVSFEVTGMT